MDYLLPRKFRVVTVTGGLLVLIIFPDRDVKVLGKFRADLGTEVMAMLVEIQIIDAAFLEVKRLMHPLYKIERGDFW